MLNLFRRKRPQPFTPYVPANPQAVTSASIDNVPAYREAVEKLAELQRKERAASAAWRKSLEERGNGSSRDAAAQAVFEGADVATLPAIGSDVRRSNELYDRWQACKLAVEMQRKRVEQARAEAGAEICKPLKEWFLAEYAQFALHAKRAAYLADEIAGALDHLHSHGGRIEQIVRPMPVHPWLSLRRQSGLHSWLVELFKYHPEVAEMVGELDAEFFQNEEEERHAS